MASLSRPNFTPAELIEAVKKVYLMAHNGKYIYSDSTSTPPCADHKISCDRLVFRALYNLGFTDQRKGGQVCGTADGYLTRHGFYKNTNIKNVQAGDIILVDDGGSHLTPYATWHMFFVISYDPKTGICKKYDCGSNQRIQSAQPFTCQLLEWGNTRRFYASYRTTYNKGPLNGRYVIQSAVDKNFVIDVRHASKALKANIQCYTYNRTDAQVFDFEYVKDGYYKIINKNSGLVIDVCGGKAVNKQNIQQYRWNGTNAQLWKPIKNKDGSYTFVSAVNNGFVLDLWGGKAANGKNIHLYQKNDTAAQKWFLSKR